MEINSRKASAFGPARRSNLKRLAMTIVKAFFASRSRSVKKSWESMLKS